MSHICVCRKLKCVLFFRCQVVELIKSSEIISKKFINSTCIDVCTFYASKRKNASHFHRRLNDNEEINKIRDS